MAKGRKTGGRQKGTKNKRSLFSVMETLIIAGSNPVQELLRLIPVLEEKEQAKVWLELLSYTQGKPKDPVEDEVEDTTQERSTADILQMVKTDGGT